MKEVNVQVQNAYKVIIQQGILKSIPSMILATVKTDSVCIITDSNVAPLYLNDLICGFEQLNIRVLSYIIPSGEQSKNLDNFAKILSFLAQNGFKRSDLLVALGGGVVGDLCGFVASAYHRGVNFVQVPTTLLAGIDSSVGGKTAVDLPEGKNLVGAFYQPKGVFFDTLTLNTLPNAEMINGYGELVKYGVLMGGKLWDLLKQKDVDLDECISLCVQYKASIVQMDEKDNGIRALLNLGHTLAHSVENISGYTIPHGVAVGYGLRRIAIACQKQGFIDNQTLNDILFVLDKFNLNYVCNYSTADLCLEAARDKKSFSQFINLVIINGLGNCSIKKYRLDELEGFFND